MEHNVQQSNNSTSRRSFLRKGLAVGGAGAIGAALLANGLPAFAEEASGGLTPGDAAILRFLSAAEILETDFWQQYNELGGIQDSEVPGAAGVLPTSRLFQCWMRTCPSISTTIPRMSSPTSHSSMPTWFPKVAIPSIWISFAPCPAVKQPAPSKSGGSPTSCSSPWTPVTGRSTAAAPRTPISGTPSHQPSRGCLKGSFRPFPDLIPTGPRRT